MKKIFSLFASIGIFLTRFLRVDLYRSLVIILLGPPGVGKGTYAMQLSKQLNIPHISTGDTFRENLLKNTPLGKKAKKFIEKGELVPDKIVISLLLKRISQKDCQKGCILDGFPRTLKQAQALENIYKKKIALYLEIDDKHLIERITGRLVCRNCKNIQHRIFLPPKIKNICDMCGGSLYQRDDDREEVIKKRLEVYYNQTQPLISYYQQKKILYNIDANRGIKEILKDLLAKISTIQKNIEE